VTFETRWLAGLPTLNNLADQRLIVLILQPFFEEANRMRRTLALMARALDDRGFGVAIPDLPGMGEHPMGAVKVAVRDIETATKALCDALANYGRPILVASFRAACLFDALPRASANWRFAPEPGDRLVRTLMRTETPEESNETLIFVNGQWVCRDFLDELSRLPLPDPSRLRTLRLATDRTDADRHVEASPLWRHAEPGEDPALAELLAEDILQWAVTCGIS
jgi:hypothetical protein